MGRRVVSLLRLMSMALPSVNFSGERKPLQLPETLGGPAMTTRAMSC